MAAITIPKSAHKALESLIGLEEHEFSILLTALSEARADLSMSHYAESVASRFEDKRPVIEVIVNELFQIDGLREALDLSPAELGRTVAEAAATLDFISKDNRLVLKQRLQQLFETQTSLKLTAKAGGVASDFERVFYNARIMTDIRPVFDASGTVVEAAAIIHNLVIHFGEDSGHKDFYVALDVQDLEALRESLDRASAKANTLRVLLGNTKVPYLSPQQ